MRFPVWTEGRDYKTQRDGKKVNGTIQGEVAVNAKDQIKIKCYKCSKFKVNQHI